MAGKDIAAMATTRPKSVARRLWRVVRAVLFMLRRGVLPTGRKLAMDLSLLLRRGKIAGKALGGLVSFHHPRAAAARSSSAAATPRSDEDAWYYGNYDAADVAKVFEMLNDGGHLFDDDALLAVAPATATPSPAPRYSSRKLRVTDSPFATSDSDSASEQQQVDRKADEFIRRFYDQLRAQRSRAATPDSYGYAAGSYAGYSPRPVAAGIA
ncbi:uncharacterized protein LOC124686893 [Lolium rigidum]|uniref:uncharacterized protein LOC124686893 n=1 Tax=Lolium rigidum TaxID=89674 RepID=UPI001F5E02C2|nr:uncharacterized protein LOC124686893 [Lolium rigidum]